MTQPTFPSPLQGRGLSNAAIADLAAVHDRDVRSAIRRVLGRSQEENDLVQEVFVRLVIRLRQPGDVVVGAWVRRVAHNLAVDEVRRRRAIPVEETRLDRPAPCRVDERHDGAQLYSDVLHGARGLPDRQRAALASVLAADGVPPVAAVASRLGLTEDAAESLIRRARTGLRAQLATAGAEGGAVRPGLAWVAAAFGLVWTWLARHWRAASLAAAVAAGSVTAVATVPGSAASPQRPLAAGPVSSGAPSPSVATAPAAPPEAAVEEAPDPGPSVPEFGPADPAGTTAGDGEPSPVPTALAVDLPCATVSVPVDPVAAGAQPVLESVLAPVLGSVADVGVLDDACAVAAVAQR
jgi:RNA polymerase sigma factor (sigma-70 family)